MNARDRGVQALPFPEQLFEDSLAGRGQEVFNAAVLSVAVVMLGWHNLWMASHGRELAGEMKAMGQAVAGGDTSLVAMAIVVAIAVLREGAEVVLFLYGVAAASTEGWGALLVGGLLGVVLGAAVSFLLYLGLLAIPLRRLFSVTAWLIALVAWTVTASHWTIGQMAIVYLLTFVVGIGHFAHCIAGSGEILSAVVAGTVPVADYLRWLAPATMGNICGGVLIVSLLNYGQVKNL